MSGSQSFQTAIAYVIAQHEGGFQCNPRDPGNWTGGRAGAGELRGTKYGISAASFPGVDIENLTLDQAEALYLRDWWAPEYDELEPIVACKLLDMAVNWERYGKHGPAVRVLQQSIQNLGSTVLVDGVIGHYTVAAASGLVPEVLVREMCRQAYSRYKSIEAANPSESEWFHGWDLRALSYWTPAGVKTVSLASSASTAGVA